MDRKDIEQEKREDKIYWQGFSLGISVASLIVSIIVLITRVLM